MSRCLSVAWFGMIIVCTGTVVPLSAQGSYTVFTPPSQLQVAFARQPERQPGQGMVVSLSVQDSTVRFIVDTLIRQAHLHPLLGNSRLLAQRVSVQITGRPVMEALATVLHGTGLEAQLLTDGETVVIHARGGTNGDRHLSTAVGTIAGHVTDSASGAGLGGASVRVAGTKISAVTSDSGNFLLRDVPTGEQVLSIRLFGYKPADRTVTVVDSQRTVVRVTLASVPTVLSGVVTTATGEQRKVEVGNDITTLNVDSIRKITPITSVTDLLETRVPGLTIVHTSGTPGDPSRLRLRGASSISGNNDPIFIIDGVRVYSSQSDPRNDNLARSVSGSATSYAAPSPIDQLDPNDIETIDVFKGPSASALYGSDAANGVIVITTKHGHAGPTHWDLQVGTGVNWIPGTWPTNLYQFGFQDGNQFASCYFYLVGCRTDSVVAFQALNDPRYTILSHGSDQTASLSVSGGLPTLTYSLTGSASTDAGNLKLPSIEARRYEAQYGPVPNWMVHPDQYQTWGIGGTLTARPISSMSVTLASNLFDGHQQRSSLQDALGTLSGEFISGGNVLTSGVFTSLGTQPLIANEVQRATDDALTSNNTGTMSWQIRPWLPLNATAGIQTMQRTDVAYIPYGVNTGGPGGSGDTTGYYGLGRGTAQSQTLSAGTTIPLFANRVNLAAGGNVYSQSTNDFSVYTEQLAPGVSVPTTFPTTNGNNNVEQAMAGTSTYGWYLEPRLNVASRFFVAPGFRLDGGSGGSTSSGSVGGLSAFPKIDLSYIVVDRPAGHAVGGVVTQFRPRLALGLAGTQPAATDKLRLFNVNAGQNINDLPGQQGLTTSTSNGCTSVLTLDGGATTVPAVCLNALGNTQLRPERSSELEGGFDLNLWDSRLQITYTQYNKTRKDAIISIPIAPSISTGEGAAFNIAKNIGVVRNTGVEATLNALLIQQRAISWAVSANLANDQNLVVRLNPGQAPIVLNDGTGTETRVVAGYPLFGRWARPILGYADANHDGIIEPSEIQLGDSSVYLGEQTPRYQLNVSSDLTLLNGHLGVHATLAYQSGMNQINGVGSFLLQNGGTHVPLSTQASIVAGNCQAIFGATLGCHVLNGGTPIGLTQTVSMLRLTSLSINYDVPRSLSSLVRVPRMTVALQGTNLGLHSNYRGKDPDVNAFSTSSGADITADAGEIPEPRTWWLRVTVGN